MAIPTGRPFNDGLPHVDEGNALFSSDNGQRPRCEAYHGQPRELREDDIEAQAKMIKRLREKYHDECKLLTKDYVLVWEYFDAYDIHFHSFPYLYGLLQRIVAENEAQYRAWAPLVEDFIKRWLANCQKAFEMMETGHCIEDLFVPEDFEIYGRAFLLDARVQLHLLKARQTGHFLAGGYTDNQDLPHPTPVVVSRRPSHPHVPLQRFMPRISSAPQPVQFIPNPMQPGLHVMLPQGLGPQIPRQYQLQHSLPHFKYVPYDSTPLIQGPHMIPPATAPILPAPASTFHDPGPLMLHARPAPSTANNNPVGSRNTSNESQRASERDHPLKRGDWHSDPMTYTWDSRQRHATDEFEAFQTGRGGPSQYRAVPLSTARCHVPPNRPNSATMPRRNPVKRTSDDVRVDLNAGNVQRFSLGHNAASWDPVPDAVSLQQRQANIPPRVSEAYNGPEISYSKPHPNSMRRYQEGNTSPSSGEHVVAHPSLPQHSPHRFVSNPYAPSANAVPRRTFGQPVSPPAPTTAIVSQGHRNSMGQPRIENATCSANFAADQHTMDPHSFERMRHESQTRDSAVYQHMNNNPAPNRSPLGQMANTGQPVFRHDPRNFSSQSENDDAAKLGRKLWIGGLPPNLSTPEMLTIVQPCHGVSYVSDLLPKQGTFNSRFFFASFETANDAEEALEKLPKTRFEVLDGYPVVRYAYRQTSLQPGEKDKTSYRKGNAQATKTTPSTKATAGARKFTKVASLENQASYRRRSSAASPKEGKGFQNTARIDYEHSTGLTSKTSPNAADLSAIEQSVTPPSHQYERAAVSSSLSHDKYAMASSEAKSITASPPSAYGLGESNGTFDNKQETHRTSESTASIPTDGNSAFSTGSPSRKNHQARAGAAKSRAKQGSSSSETMGPPAKPSGSKTQHVSDQPRLLLNEKSEPRAQKEAKSEETTTNTKASLNQEGLDLKLDRPPKASQDTAPSTDRQEIASDPVFSAMEQNTLTTGTSLLSADGNRKKGADTDMSSESETSARPTRSTSDTKRMSQAITQGSSISAGESEGNKSSAMASTTATSYGPTERTNSITNLPQASKSPNRHPGSLPSTLVPAGVDPVHLRSKLEATSRSNNGGPIIDEVQYDGMKIDPQPGQLENPPEPQSPDLSLQTASDFNAPKSPERKDRPEIPPRNSSLASNSRPSPVKGSKKKQKAAAAKQQGSSDTKASQKGLTTTPDETKINEEPSLHVPQTDVPSESSTTAKNASPPSTPPQPSKAVITTSQETPTIGSKSKKKKKKKSKASQSQHLSVEPQAAPKLDLSTPHSGPSDPSHISSTVNEEARAAIREAETPNPHHSSPPSALSSPAPMQVTADEEAGATPLTMNQNNVNIDAVRISKRNLILDAYFAQRDEWHDVLHTTSRYGFLINEDPAEAMQQTDVGSSDGRSTPSTSDEPKLAAVNQETRNEEAAQQTDVGRSDGHLNPSTPDKPRLADANQEKKNEKAAQQTRLGPDEDLLTMLTSDKAESADDIQRMAVEVSENLKQVFSEQLLAMSCIPSGTHTTSVIKMLDLLEKLPQSDAEHSIEFSKARKERWSYHASELVMDVDPLPTEEVEKMKAQLKVDSGISLAATFSQVMPDQEFRTSLNAPGGLSAEDVLPHSKQDGRVPANPSSSRPKYHRHLSAEAALLIERIKKAQGSESDQPVSIVEAMKAFGDIKIQYDSKDTSTLQQMILGNMIKEKMKEYVAQRGNDVMNDKVVGPSEDKLNSAEVPVDKGKGKEKEVWNEGNVDSRGQEELAIDETPSECSTLKLDHAKPSMERDAHLAPEKSITEPSEEKYIKKGKALTEGSEVAAHKEGGPGKQTKDPFAHPDSTDRTEAIQSASHNKDIRRAMRSKSDPPTPTKSSMYQVDNPGHESMSDKDITKDDGAKRELHTSSAQQQHTPIKDSSSTTTASPTLAGLVSSTSKPGRKGAKSEPRGRKCKKSDPWALPGNEPAWGKGGKGKKGDNGGGNGSGTGGTLELTPGKA